jgi:hypothetical protein
MQQGHSTATVIVLIEKSDDTIEYVTWSGSSMRRIHVKAKAQYTEKYPGCKVSFGNALYTNHYGAH